MMDSRLYHMENAEIAIFASFVYPDIKTMMLIYQYSKLLKKKSQSSAIIILVIMFYPEKS